VIECVLVAFDNTVIILNFAANGGRLGFGLRRNHISDRGDGGVHRQYLQTSLRLVAVRECLMRPLLGEILVHKLGRMIS
jgi:hypothetical protein